MTLFYVLVAWCGAHASVFPAMQVSPSALDLLSPPDELRSWMPQHLQVKLHQFVQEHLASSGAQRKGAKLNQEQGSPGREDTQAPVVQSADLTRTKTNAVHTIRNRLQQLLKWGIIGPALHARQLAAVNDVSSSWSYSSAGGPLEADALVVKGAPGRRNTEELRRALLEKGPRELQVSAPELQTMTGSPDSTAGLRLACCPQLVTALVCLHLSFVCWKRAAVHLCCLRRHG